MWQPLMIVANEILHTKMGDKLAGTDKVVAQLHAMGGFNLSAYGPKNLQGT